jgi:hypothetical protein
MIKLNVNWNQTCHSCGTDLVFELPEESRTRVVCPWCGVEVDPPVLPIDPQAFERVAAQVREFEARLNAEFGAKVEAQP